MTPRKLLLASALPLIAAAVGGPVGAAPRTDVVVEAPRQVTSGPNPLRLYDIPALAVDPNDPSTVALAVGDARNGGCGLRVSRDGGLSWTTTAENLLAEPTDYCIQRAFGPVMAPAFGSDGTLYVAMPRSSSTTDFSNGPIDLVIARTTDLGATHDLYTVAKSETYTINPADYGGAGPVQEGNTWNKFMSLTVDPANSQHLFLAWRWTVWGKDLRGLQGDVPFRPFFASSEDGGRTWSKPVDLITVGQGEKPFGASGPVLVQRGNTLYGFSKELIKSPPSGQPRPPARLLMFKSTDAGRTWTTSVVNEGAQGIGNPQPGIDPKTGKLHVVYEQRGATAPAGSPPNPQDILYVSSSDDGATWSKPTTISDDPPAQRADQYYPGISVAPDGRVDVAWHDFRNDPFFYPGETGNMGTAVGARWWDVYYTYSTDGGATWKPNIRVTNPSIDAMHGGTFNNIDTRGPIGIASTNGAVYVAWSDSRATTDENDAEDVYASRLRFAGVPELGASTSTGGDGLLWGVVGAGAALAAGGLVLLLFRRTASGSGVPVGTAKGATPARS